MKISIQFIDEKGFIHFEVGKSKKKVLDFIEKLREGTEVKWLDGNRLFISQQYVRI